ncbi:MAG: hypothetical protein JNM27_23310 [Leptospirales bacterium]|nr:hypothetical protein [Leptospirales bacterium]
MKEIILILVTTLWTGMLHAEEFTRTGSKLGYSMVIGDGGYKKLTIENGPSLWVPGNLWSGCEKIFKRYSKGMYKQTLKIVHKRPQPSDNAPAGFNLLSRCELN